MQELDWIVLILFFLSMLGLGLWSYLSKNKNTADYFVASGNVPWWLVGISHHISGYSGAVFVAYAALAYSYGFSLYVWWAFAIGVAMIATAKIFPVYWVRARINLMVQSPLEYLSKRYNLLTQQVIAWCGVLLKVFDVAAKWAAIAIIIEVITGVPIMVGILISGVISLLYITFGGIWAVMATDLIQFIVQLAGGIVMFVLVVGRLGGWGSITGMWDRLPAGHAHLFNDPYTVGFAVVFLFVALLSYNGGNWGLATRYLSAPDEQQASKASYLSGVLYLIWPLILFFPMWAAPLILPDLSNPSHSYALLMLEILPPGFVGLVAASLFAATMSMVASDITTLSAVITRDILPNTLNRFKDKEPSLFAARMTTFLYSILTILIASQFQRFGGVFGLIVVWFGALVGIIAVPLLLGLLPVRLFRNCGPTAAISAIIGGLLAFIITKSLSLHGLTIGVGLPMFVSFVIYSFFGLFNRNKQTPAQVANLLDSLKTG